MPTDSGELRTVNLGAILEGHIKAGVDFFLSVDLPQLSREHQSHQLNEKSDKK